MSQLLRNCGSCEQRQGEGAAARCAVAEGGMSEAVRAPMRAWAVAASGDPPAAYGQIGGYATGCPQWRKR